MKLKLLKILLFPTIVTFLNGYNPKFANFILEMVHKYNFYNCDNTIIQKVFSAVDGEDIRVNVSKFDNIRNQISLTTTFGYPNDSVYIYSVIRKDNNKCYVDETAVITFNKSCIEVQNSDPQFKLKGRTADFFWTQNKIGVIKILKPLNTNQCLVIFEKDFASKQDH